VDYNPEERLGTSPQQHICQYGFFLIEPTKKNLVLYKHTSILKNKIPHFANILIVKEILT